MQTDNAVNSSNDAPLRTSPAAFIIDFGEGRGVDLERHKSLVEKYQKRHRRGASASKLDENSKASSTASTTPTAPKKLSFSRKSSSSVEGSSYDVSSSEEQRSAASAGPVSPLSRKLINKRERLSLPLKSAPGATERMVQSFTDYDLNNTGVKSTAMNRTGRGLRQTLKSFVKQVSSPECDVRILTGEKDENSPVQTIGGALVDGTDLDFDRRSDTVSETGTYTIDADVYTNEQKERMSIDREFRILDPVAGACKVAEYVSQLVELNGNDDQSSSIVELATVDGLYYDDQSIQNGLEKMEVGGEEEMEAFDGYNSDNDKGVAMDKLELIENKVHPHNNPSPTHLSANNIRLKKPTSLFDQHFKPHLQRNDTSTRTHQMNRATDLLPHTRHITEFPNTKLSPIMSPTQPQNDIAVGGGGGGGDGENRGKSFTKIMFPTSKGRCNNVEQMASRQIDQGSVISVTSSGAFRARSDLQRKSSLTKSDIYVEAYTDHQMELRIKQQHTPTTPTNTLSASLVHMTSTVTSSIDKPTNLPPSIGGKTSPSKIPSPVHGAAATQHRRIVPSADCNAFSDSLDTECYLKPTQQLLSELERRLETGDKLRRQHVWNNDASCYNMAKRAVHVRHNSLDDGNMQISNKLEHFQRKNLCIDQTVIGDVRTGNGYGMAVYPVAPPTPPTPNQSVVRKVQNSPNNSPIRRSGSFTTHNPQKHVTNRLNQMQTQKDLNMRNSPMLGGRNTLQKSASTTNIKPLAAGGGGTQTSGRRGSITSNEVSANSDHHHTSPHHHQQQQLHHRKIDRSKYGDTESSSDDDVQLHQTLAATVKRKDITGTRDNRAFSLRRGRLEDNGCAEPQQDVSVNKCPNTPEMRRKFGGGVGNERATSVDRKPSTGKHLHDIPSRYLQTTNTPVTVTPQHPRNSHTFKRNTRHGSAPPSRRDTSHIISDQSLRQTRTASACVTGKSSSGGVSGGSSPGGHFSRGEPARFSTGRSGAVTANKPMTNSQKTIRCGSAANVARDAGGGGSRTKQPGPRSNSSLSSKEVEFANWKRRTCYDPMKAAAEGKKRAELAKKHSGNSMTQSFTEATNQNSCDSSPSHSSSVHRSQSFHGTAATLSTATNVNHRKVQHHHRPLSSDDEAGEDDDDDDDDLTLSVDEDGPEFSPPTPSPSHQHYPSPWQMEMRKQAAHEQVTSKDTLS